MSDDEWARSVARAQSMHAGSILSREVDRLRAELAETRAELAAVNEVCDDRTRERDALRVAGDTLAGRAFRITPTSKPLDWWELGEAGMAWRSVATR